MLLERIKFTPGLNKEGTDYSVVPSWIDGDKIRCHILIGHAHDLGFTGIGVAKTFIHLDVRDTTPVMWVY